MSFLAAGLPCVADEDEVVEVDDFCRRNVASLLFDVDDDEETESLREAATALLCLLVLLGATIGCRVFKYSWRRLSYSLCFIYLF